MNGDYYSRKLILTANFLLMQSEKGAFGQYPPDFAAVLGDFFNLFPPT
jgi:hypothetical protein